jgi:hypothetical protein
MDLNIYVEKIDYPQIVAQMEGFYKGGGIKSIYTGLIKDVLFDY